MNPVNRSPQVFLKTIFLIHIAHSFSIFRQHAVSIYGFVRPFIRFISFVDSKKKIQATSKQGRRLRFGMLTVLTNIRSTKVLW